MRSLERGERGRGQEMGGVMIGERGERGRGFRGVREGNPPRRRICSFRVLNHISNISLLLVLMSFFVSVSDRACFLILNSHRFDSIYWKSRFEAGRKGVEMVGLGEERGIASAPINSMILDTSRWPPRHRPAVGCGTHGERQGCKASDRVSSGHGDRSRGREIRVDK